MLMLLLSSLNAYSMYEIDLTPIVTEAQKAKERSSPEPGRTPEEEKAEQGRIFEKEKAAAEVIRNRSNDIYTEIYVTDAKNFSMLNNDYFTFSFYPETSGWHIFQTYGPTDTVMEIYHKGESIVYQGASDGDKGDYKNELQRKYLEAGGRYVVQVHLQSVVKYGQAMLNIRADEREAKLEDPLTLGYAKKVWLNPDSPSFTTKFTPTESIRYNIEAYSEGGDTVMDIFDPEGYSMVTCEDSEGDTDGDKGVKYNELQVLEFEAGKTYKIKVNLGNLRNEKYVWVHFWRSAWNPLTL